MSHALPSYASVVVIGGGIMGTSTLYHGVSDAILLERNKLTSGTTWHSAAQVRALRHSRNLTRMIQYSVELYAQLEAETGQSVGGFQKGSLSIATTQGSVICNAIALCGGQWSRELGAMAGAEVPLWPCEHFYLLTKPIEGITGNMPTHSDHDNHLYIRDDSSGLLVGCFEPMGKAIKPGVLDENFEFGLLGEDWDRFEPMMGNALHRLPALETTEVKMLLNGPESFTPDGAFMLGEIDVEGPDAEAFLLHVCAGYTARKLGSVIYTAMLNERGTFESDLTAQRISDTLYRLFVGTNVIKRDLT